MGRFIQTPGSTTAEFDEKLLREIADLTGGKYSSAGSSEDLRQIYHEIDLLDREEEKTQSLQQIDELFLPFAVAGACAYLLLVLLSRTVLLKVPCL